VKINSPIKTQALTVGFRKYIGILMTKNITIVILNHDGLEPKKYLNIIVDF